MTNKSNRKIENIPTTEVLYALQRVGYDTNQAICDIIDNSVDAHRERYNKNGNTNGFVRINIEGAGTGGTKKRLAPDALVIADNATGIDPEILEQVLSMGKSEKRGKSMLGTFGMGLKTAGLALGEIITVVSTTSTIKNLKSVVWDVQDTMKHGSWMNDYYDKPPEKHIEYYKKYVGTKAGTLVLIENLHVDRFLARATAAKQALAKECARIYRHILDEKDYLGHHFPIKIFVDGHPCDIIDPLCVGEDGTNNVIHDGNCGFKKITYETDNGSYELSIRMTHYELGRKHGPARDQKTLSGHGFHGLRRQGTYFIRGGREIHKDCLWKLSKDISNVFMELSFTDDGTGTDDSLIEVNFGKTKANINPDLKTWLLKNHVKPYLAEIAKAAKKRQEAKKLADQKSLKDKVRKVPLPKDTFGTAKGEESSRKRANKALQQVFKKPDSEKARKKSTVPGAISGNIKVNEDNVYIDYEEVSWVGSPLPYDISYSPGDGKVVMLINTEHDTILDKLYHDKDMSRVNLSLQLMTSFAVSLMHEKADERHDIIIKQAVLWDILPTEGDVADSKVTDLKPVQEVKKGRTAPRGPRDLYKETRFASAQS